MKSIPEHELKAEEVHQMLLDTLQIHLSLKTEGYRCTTEQVFNVLLKAAAEGSSLEAVCSDQPSGLDGNTVREHLNAALEVSHLRQQEAEMNQALASVIPLAMPRGGLEVAIDSHDEPFYGKTPEMLTYTRKAQAKDGTSRFFRIASAYVIWHEVRLTLALTYVLPEDDLPGVVRRLLQRLTHLGVHACVLYLDKGFCCGAVIQHLQQVGQATVLACPIRGKRGGMRALCRGRGSRLTKYAFSDGTQVRLALVETRVPDKTGRRRRKWLAFVLINLNWTPHQVYQKYRRRFGIECSYRLLRQVKVLTNSRNPALRFFLLALGLVMQKVWIHLRWLCTRRPGKGRYKLIPTLLRFDRFRKLLIRAIEVLFPPLRTVLVYALPNP